MFQSLRKIRIYIYKIVYHKLSGNTTPAPYRCYFTGCGRAFFQIVHFLFKSLTQLRITLFSYQTCNPCKAQANTGWMKGDGIKDYEVQNKTYSIGNSCCRVTGGVFFNLIQHRSTKQQHTKQFCRGLCGTSSHRRHPYRQSYRGGGWQYYRGNRHHATATPG